MSGTNVMRITPNLRPTTIVKNLQRRNGSFCMDSPNSSKDILQLPLTRYKKMDVREGALNHYCGYRCKCHDAPHHGHQWKNGDIRQAQVSLRRHLVEKSKIISTLDRLIVSTQANDPRHAVKWKYKAKCLTFTASTDARSPLGVAS
jgi:hypothetical protein